MSDSQAVKYGLSCDQEDCQSSDAVTLYDDGHTHCFSCGHHSKGDRDIPEDYTPRQKTREFSLIGLPEKNQPPLRDRNIPASVIKKYKVTTDIEGIEAVFPLFNDEGHVANQVRYPGKGFKSEGRPSGAHLFGQDLFPAGGKVLTITEGYYDAMSAFFMTGARYSNVGVQSASSAKKQVIENFEYVNSFEKVVLNFDNDDPGKKAAQEVAALFEPGKVKLLELSKAKDANDYLQKNLLKEYVDEWYRAPAFMPDGLQLGTDPRLLEEILEYVEPRSVPYPFEGLNHVLYGLRTSEFVLITADTGVGKTSFIKEIQYKLLMDEELQKEKAGVGFLHFEEPKRKTALGLMSIHNNKPYHFPDVERTAEELADAYRAVLDTDRVVIYDHFGSSSIDSVLSKIRHMAALGCRYIFVDHLSIIVSDQSGDERKQLDEISTKLKTLTMNLDICCVCVIHINRQGQVRGSAGPEQVSNAVIRLERDKKDMNEWRRNVTRVFVEKNREFGRTGPASYIFYNEMTGRLEELPRELAEEYENGGSNAGHEFDSYGG